jgi:hypothetical protein
MVKVQLVITPELGIALGSGYPGGFFNETALTDVNEVFAAQLLPTVVAAEADPVNTKTATVKPVAAATRRLRIDPSFICGRFAGARLTPRRVAP